MNRGALVLAALIASACSKPERERSWVDPAPPPATERDEPTRPRPRKQERAEPPAPRWVETNTSTIVRGVLRSSSSGVGLQCRPPVCAKQIVDPGFVVTIKLQPWRDASGVVHAERLEQSIYVPSQRAWDALDHSFPRPSAVVEVLVDDPRMHEGIEKPLYDGYGIRPAVDKELSAIAPPKALTIEDPTLGKLTWRSELGMYAGKSKSVPRYEILIDDGGTEPPDLARAAKQIAQIEERREDLRTAAAEKLIPNYNAHHGGGGPERDAAWLAAQLRLENARLAPDRDDVVLLYAGGAAFERQSVEVAVEAGVVVSATLAD